MKSRPAPPVVADQTDRSVSSDYVPTEEWTCRLIDRGFTLDDAASIRGLDLSAILRHLTLAARQGRAVPPEAFLEPEILQRWDEWRSERGDAVPPPDRPASEAMWNLYLACRAHR